VRYCCPFCKSSDIERSSLVEHIKCGYMDIESNFLLDNELTCPKCHVALKNIDVDFRKAGIWCTCKTCRKSFDIPVPEHFCRTCNAKSTFEDVVIKDVYAYSLKANGITESSLNCLFADAIRKFLIEQDLLVKSPATFQGKSGAQHSFDIVGFKGKGSEKPIVFDLAISTSGVVSEQPVISLFAKIFDISTEKAYLIAVPKLSENGRKMAELYKISAIEARNQEEAINSLRKDLGTV